MKKQKGFSLISILMALVILALLYYNVNKFYFQKSIDVEKKVKKSLKEQGVDVENYQDMTDTAKETADDINKKIDKRGQVSY